jgi:methylaspartate mutase sigma subunit
MTRQPIVVLGVIGHDIHVVANQILAIGLAENGFQPVNIGTNTDVDDFVDATREVGAEAVLVSSINGEGEQACTGFGARFASAGLAGVLRYAGGNLVIGHRPPAEVEGIFTGYGFHRVFHQPADFTGMFTALSHDLGHVAA